MLLTLTVIGYKGETFTEPFSRTFAESGGSVGRSPGNDWVLPDEDKVVSGKHAVIEYRDTRFEILDVSRNGVFVNESEEPLGEGNSARLEHGDVLHIGDYEIRVELQDAEEGATEFPTAAGPLGLSTRDFLTDTDFGAEDAGAERDAARAPVEVDIDLGSADREAIVPPGSSRPAPSPGAGQAAPAGGSGEIIPEDWDQTSFDPLLTEPEPEPMPARKPSPPKPPPRAARKARERPRPTRDAVPAGTAVAQFLAGAGIEDPDLIRQLPADVMLQLGRTYREAIDGAMTVLAARTRLKSEFRLEVTVLQPRENNPLKFSVGVDDAIRHLLRPSEGAMPPVDAVREAFADIQGHQVAVMAGLRSALRELLRRFRPERLERRIAKSGVLDSLLPQSRKAKSWDLFTSMYDELVQEAEDDFQRVFGEEFSRAYNEQIRVLRKKN